MEPPPIDTSITQFIMKLIIIIFGIICISIGRWFGKPRGGYTPIPYDRFKTGFRDNKITS